jgi:hypothetical protein
LAAVSAYVLRLQRVQVVLHQGVSQEVQLRAYLHATHLAATLSQVSSSSRARWHQHGPACSSAILAHGKAV